VLNYSAKIQKIKYDSHYKNRAYIGEQNLGKTYHDQHVSSGWIDAATEEVVIKHNFSLNLLVACSQDPPGNPVAV
jgi:hypothetical protein